MLPMHTRKTKCTVRVNSKGCKNCAAAIIHLLEVYCGLSGVEINTEMETIRCTEEMLTSRIENVLVTSGWEIDRGGSHLLPLAVACSDDHHFVPLTVVDTSGEEDYDSIPKKRKMLSRDFTVQICQTDSQNQRNSAITDDPDSCQNIASHLVAILSPEIECRHTHWVPGWAVLVLKGRCLHPFLDILNKMRPLSKSMVHLKRIDSCRSGMRAGIHLQENFVPVFLGLSESSFRFEDALRLVASITSKLPLQAGEQDYSSVVSPQPTACWVPFCAPITRQQQLTYTDPASSCQLKNDLSKLVFGWPSTIRANPDLERVLLRGLQYVGQDELQRHDEWLNQVIKMSETAGPTCASCAGHRSQQPNAVIFVDPNTNLVIAKATTPSVEKTADDSCTLSLLDHAVVLAVADNAGNQLEDKEKKYYLCTGLDAYLAMEPCVMCTMALVHNRIKRVFCAKRLPFAGGFTNNTRIHTEKRLNHRFQVYAPPLS